MLEPAVYLPLMGYTLYKYGNEVRGINLALLISWSVEAVTATILFLFESHWQLHHKEKKFPDLFWIFWYWYCCIKSILSKSAIIPSREPLTRNRF